MKKSLHMKLMLLLFALVVGCSNVWATSGDILNETFETGSTTASSWSMNAVSGHTSGYATIDGNAYYNGSKGLHLGSGSNAYGSGTTPVLSNMTTNATMTFWAKAKTNQTLYLSASGCTLNKSSVSVTNSWAQYTVNISSGTSSAVINFYKNGSNQNYVYIDDVVITSSAPSHTLSSAVSPSGVGTVTLGATSVIEGGSTTIVATATNDEYRFKNWTSTSGTITNVNSASTTFTMGTENATVTAVFEEKPSHTLSVAVSPSESGNVTLGATSVKEGLTTTASAAASAGYKFKNWSITGTGASLSSTSTNPTTVTMGTEDATVTATFEAVTTHAITYSVNGHETTINVEEDADVDLSAPASALIPVGYYFKGWRTEELALTNDDPDDYVTSSTSTEDITYYAVVAVKTEIAADTYEKLGNTSFDGDDTYVLCGIQGGSGGDGSTLMYLSSYGAIDEDISWGGCTSTPATVAPVKFRLSGTATQLVAKDNSGNYLTKSSDEKKFAMSSTSKTVYLDSDGSIKTASDGWRLRYNHNNGSGGFRWYNGTTGQQVYFYKVVDNCTYGSFCTTVSPISLDDDVTISGDLDVTYSLTVQSNTILTVNGTLSIEGGGSITIEDGGQLITNSSVALTYNKNMKESDKAVNWYTIATPVHYKNATDTDSIRVSDVTNLILDKDSYDFFYYDEYNSTLGGAYWMNYKASHPGFPFKVGQGFLYRNDGSKLSFAGTSNSAASYTYSLKYTGAAGDLAGINLIGNPYPHNITMDYVTVGDGTLAGGYVLSESDGWAAEVATTIAPTQGFLVQISTSGQTATIHKSEPDPGKSRANRDYIKFIVNNSHYEDATFALFDKCDGLNKIDHRNADIPMIYIPQDGQNFAIATMSDETQSFNLNFKAKTTGKYTLSYQTKGNYSYLHVIDRLTGEDIDMLLDGEYSFIASPQDNAARFIVKLSYNANGNNTNENDIFAFQSGSDIIVNGEGELQVFDVTGRQVMNTTINGMESINIPAQGVYIFRLNEKVQKIVVR